MGVNLNEYAFSGVYINLKTPGFVEGRVKER